MEYCLCNFYVRWATSPHFFFPRIYSSNIFVYNISLGWSYGKENSIEIDEYESNRKPRRSQIDLVLTRQEREEILLDWGASFQEIVDSIRSNIRQKNQRRHTVNTLGRYDKWEEMMESAGRRLKRTILLQKTSGQRAKELSAQVQPNFITVKGPHGDQTIQHHHHHHHHVQHQGQTHRVVYATADSNAEESKECISNSHHSHHHNIISDPQNTEGDTAPQDYVVQINDAERQNAGVAAVTTLSRIDRQDSMNGSNPSLSAPLFEIDVLDGTEVESRISYEDTIMYQQSYASRGGDDDDSYSSDGFGHLIRDTRHWYVDGRDGAPTVHRRVTPTIISEDDFFGSEQNQEQQHQIVFDQHGRPYLIDQYGQAFMIEAHQIVSEQQQPQNYYAEQPPFAGEQQYAGAPSDIDQEARGQQQQFVAESNYRHAQSEMDRGGFGQHPQQYLAEQQYRAAQASLDQPGGNGGNQPQQQLPYVMEQQFHNVQAAESQGVMEHSPQHHHHQMQFQNYAMQDQSPSSAPYLNTVMVQSWE
uniref:Uncharacterized protein n=1 Tax=Entomoneis paludosa TaxID=265537 RepID=A0A7S2VI43_9STRA|mmetsp:Transcript_2000/g.4213  ORF Transcript_2000/g.4213 Transcript_2000/m.4213 type:complete len:530 (+) Transcript_2000:393-1982(+)